jgi:glutathione peroxidase
MQEEIKSYSLLRVSSALIVFIILFAALSTGSSGDKNNELKSEIKSGENLEDNISDISVTDMDENIIPMSDYHGKVLLIVNVASKCGYTKQYAGLQKIYDKYKDQGFEILAFPCNQFGGQEPGTNEEIENFCSVNFGVTFKLFDKIDVKGENQSPLYARLTNNDVTGNAKIKWNFAKFLISKEGNIIARYSHREKPESGKIISDIEQELAKIIE